MAELILGPLCEELLELVKDAAIKAVTFGSILKRIESTLQNIAPIFEDIIELDKKLDRTQLETEMFKNQLEKGLKTVRKCERIKRWNYMLRPYYANKLEELEQSLLRFCQTVVTLQSSRDNRKILIGVNSLVISSSSAESSVRMKEFADSCVPEAVDFVVGFEEPLRDLKREIINDSERVTVLSAPGGCGKTTLAKMICHDIHIIDTFKENIFFVTFSKAPNLKTIVEKMFRHKGYQDPQYQTEEEAFNKLEQLLKQSEPNPVLVVLDDVWPGSESYIDKFNFRIPGYKILVTLRSVFPRFFAHKLKLMNHEDAMRLYCHHSEFLDEASSGISVDIVDKIVRGCGGFPLALKVVGRSLCGKQEVYWKRRLKQWSQGKSIFCSESCDNELLNCLQSSIDALDGVEKLKECYLDLASFPEDHRIPITALVDMWTELYNLDENGDDALINLYELSDRNLIDLVFASNAEIEGDGYYDEHAVQHDILRELAMYKNDQNSIEQRERLIIDIRTNGIPEWWNEQTQQPVCAQLVSLSTDEPISDWYEMELPNVKVLVLNIQGRNYNLPPFMEKIKHLKALIITNNGIFSTHISNLSLVAHLQRLKRIRLEHVHISSIANSILQLKSLRKMSLIMCKVDEAFKECSNQKHDMPNLVEIVIDYCSDLVEIPTWLCNIISLEKLSITNCHELVSLPEELGNLVNLQVLKLSSCTNLIKLPKSIGNLHKLNFLNLSDCVSISNLPERMHELCGLRKLNMRGCHGIQDLPGSLKDLKHLNCVICDEETSYLWKQYTSYLTNLKVVVIAEVPSLKWLI